MNDDSKHLFLEIDARPSNYSRLWKMRFTYECNHVPWGHVECHMNWNHNGSGLARHLSSWAVSDQSNGCIIQSYQFLWFLHFFKSTLKFALTDGHGRHMNIVNNFDPGRGHLSGNRVAMKLCVPVSRCYVLVDNFFALITEVPIPSSTLWQNKRFVAGFGCSKCDREEVQLLKLRQHGGLPRLTLRSCIWFASLHNFSLPRSTST